jgi:hypothetical protein
VTRYIAVPDANFKEGGGQAWVRHESWPADVWAGPFEISDPPAAVHQVTVSRQALAVILNYAHHLAQVMASTTGLDDEIREALAVVDEEFRK